MAKQLSDFEKAFAAARAKYKADKGTNPLDPKYNFDFKGKKYNVEYAEEMKARKGGKSSSAAPSKSSDSSGAPSKGTGAPIRKRTLEDMQKEGKETKFYKDAVKENEDQWSKDKDTMADIAITGASLLGPGMALRGARAGYNAYKGYKAARAAGTAAKAAGTAGNAVRTVEGTLLPREAARLSGPRTTGVQNRLSGPKPAPRSPKPDTVYVNPQGEASGSRAAVGAKRLSAPYKKPTPSVPKRPEVIRINEKGDEVLYTGRKAAAGTKRPHETVDELFPKDKFKNLTQEYKEGMTAAQNKAIDNLNKWDGYKKGGKVKKMAMGGMAAPGFNSNKMVSMPPGGARSDMNVGRLSGKTSARPFKEGGNVKKLFAGGANFSPTGTSGRQLSALKNSPSTFGNMPSTGGTRIMMGQGPNRSSARPFKEGGKVKKEAKDMNCGGKVMKYGRGGGIERRGSGAGTVIKGYKKGGSIDGLSRVKTKGKVC